MKKEYLIYKLSEEMKEATRIDNELFPKFDVKRGLRNEDGTGVLVGLTKIGNVVGYERIPGGGLKPIPGKLFYRGYDVEDISHAIIKEKRFGFEEVAYLLLSGRLPDKEELASFRELINDNMALEQKTKMNIIELEGNNIMNILSRSVLEMYRFDPDADDTSRDNLMRQSIDLISSSRPSLRMLIICSAMLHSVVPCTSVIRRRNSLLPRISSICSKKIIRNWMPVRSTCY